MGREHGYITIADDGSVTAYRQVDPVTPISLGGLQHQSATVLTNDQIKALPSAPVELIPAPGEDRAIVPLAIILKVSLTAVYTNVAGVGSNGYMVMQVGDGVEIGGYFYENRMQAVFDQAASGLTVHQGLPADTATTPPMGPEGVEFNEPCELKVDNAGLGNFTGGHADNAMVIAVPYLVFDLESTRFV